MAKALNKKDKKYVWHPFTNQRGWEKGEPLIIERGKGSYLFDTKGRKYLDGVSSLWVTVHGHRKKELDRAIEKQLKKIAHSTLLGLGNVPSIELAENLIKLAPRGLTRVFYSDSGSESVEIALKLAFHFWQILGKRKKTRFLTLTNAYHGDTIGSVSVGGIDLFHKTYKPLLFKSLKVPPGNIPALENILKTRHREIAAMIVEPLVQAAAGMLLYPPEYLKAVRKLCTKYGVLLIVDEVATGFGRTGKMFACEHVGITPDLMCVAKGITGGYLPLAATLTSEKIYRTFLDHTFYHGHTYTGNPLACAAALANLEIFRKERTLDKLQPKIKLLAQLLKPLLKLKQVKEIRQLGFIVGIELNISAQPVILRARKLGAILRPLGKVIVLMPPLSISEAELRKLVEITATSVAGST
ncbi:MAG: adenosylmethionine--8-amino-7-oxononanoate transaminase [Candidatus Margulisiibacteriota bacterium]